MGQLLGLLTQFGLRPIELQYLSSRINPVTGKPAIWCNYRKTGGEEETEPFLEACTSASQRPAGGVAPEQAMADGTLQLPSGRMAMCKLPGAENCYIHRKSRSSVAPAPFQTYWAELVEQYASKDPRSG